MFSRSRAFLNDMTDKNTQYICEKEYDSKSKRHLLVCSMKIGTQAGKHVAEPIGLLLKGKYGSDRPMLHKILDAAGIVALIGLALAVLYFTVPRSTPDLVVIDASVAPSEVITGGSSTLTFRYENESEEVVSSTRLTFEFPEHFALAGFESDAEQVGQQTFDLGDINPGQYGFIHVHGTMFGDVGGEQIFTTSFSYTYGEGQQDTKKSEHTFSPTTSALALELTVPEHLFGYQEIEGMITYKNTGEIDFPDVYIAPKWPNSFTLTGSDPELQDGAFHLAPVAAGEQGLITFTGRLGAETDYSFAFTPTFEFADSSYQQEILVANIEILPSPLSITHTIEEETLIPGENAMITIDYENTSSYYDLDSVAIQISADPQIFSTSDLEEVIYDGDFFTSNTLIENLKMGESGTTTMQLPVLSTLSGMTLESAEEITVETTSSAELTLTLDGQLIETHTFGDTQEIRLTTPAVLQSIGRYWASTGDQLGRGPVPPIVGEETKYWVFWSLSGTTNILADVRFEAELGDGVQLTGRQSVSVGSSVIQEDGSVVWAISGIKPTLPSGSTVVGAAFEVSMTPAEADIGTTPLLLEQTLLTARDAFTGSFISESASAITTALPSDDIASSYGGFVEE